jgi:carbamoyl-phosphate synthase large subunit
MRLLMPAVGKKVYLAGQLKKMLSGMGGVLFGSDVDDQAPALRQVDAVIALPSFQRSDYWGAVDAAIAKHGITAVLPTRDDELEAWSRRGESSELQADVSLSSSATLAACTDKTRLYAAAESCGVMCPSWIHVTAETADDALFFPSVVKPVRGSGSRNVYRVESMAQWQALVPRVSWPSLLQVWRSGIEYSVDCFASDAGQLTDCCARERLQVVDGESTAGRAIDSPELIDLCRRLASRMHFRGVINLQFIVDAEGAWLIDVNPRFPGGIAITEAAGHPFIAHTLETLGQGVWTRSRVSGQGASA